MENNENLVAYCGDCHGYRGRIPDLARNLRNLKSRYERFAQFISTFSLAKTLV